MIHLMIKFILFFNHHLVDRGYLIVDTLYSMLDRGYLIPYSMVDSLFDG